MVTSKHHGKWEEVYTLLEAECTEKQNYQGKSLKIKIQAEFITSEDIPEIILFGEGYAYMVC